MLFREFVISVSVSFADVGVGLLFRMIGVVGLLDYCCVLKIVYDLKLFVVVICLRGSCLVGWMMVVFNVLF